MTLSTMTSDNMMTLEMMTLMKPLRLFIYQSPLPTLITLAVS